ncbi:class I SAM-dependent methyltransferase [Chloroflexota bacterium]
MLDKLLDKLHHFVRKARPYLPFTELNTAYRILDKDGESILDIGCGKGEPIKFINKDKRLDVVATDIFVPYLKGCKELGIYSDFVLCDIRFLPLKRKSIDVVLCLTVIEHLEKGEGEKLLREMGEIARKQVIVSTPVGKYKQGVLDGNPYQEHRYIWGPDEFRKRGYKVRGVGIRGILGDEGFRSRLPRVIQPLAWVLWILAGPMVYFFPKLAGTQVCWKQMENST